MHHDGAEPRAEGRPIGEIVQALERPQERVVDDILDVARRALDAGREVYRERGVLSIEDAEGLRVALAPEGDELGVGEIFEGA